MVCIQVRTYFGVDARRAFALLTHGFITSPHLVHIGRRTAQVAKIPFEIRQFHYCLYFFQYAFLAAADDKLALMCRNGTESTTAETSAMNVDGELNHIVCGYAFALIFGMRETRVRQVERTVEFRFRQGRLRRVDNDSLPAYGLQDTRSSIFITLFFDMAEVGSLFLLVFQTFFMCE